SAATAWASRTAATRSWRKCARSSTATSCCRASLPLALAVGLLVSPGCRNGLVSGIESTDRLRTQCVGRHRISLPERFELEYAASSATFENRLKVRYRIDGVLNEGESPPANLTAAVISRIKIMAR